jgi:hypothetical protein
LITICDSALKRKTDKKRKVVIIMARVHPGESPASFVCHGIIFSF